MIDTEVIMKKHSFDMFEHNKDFIYHNIIHDNFPKVVEAYRNAKQKISLSDFTRHYSEYQSIGQLLIEREKLGTLFKPDLWVGNLETITQFYAHFKERYTRQKHMRDYTKQFDEIDLEAFSREVRKLEYKEKTKTEDKGPRTKPIILTCAHTGALNGPWKKDQEGRLHNIEERYFAEHLPITPEQVIKDAIKAYNAGARLIHIHARNPETGAQYANLSWYKEVLKGIRKNCPGALVSFPTSRKGEVGTQIDTKLSDFPNVKGRAGRTIRAAMEVLIRGAAVEARPDTLTTFTVPETRLLGDKSIKDKRGVEDVPNWTSPSIMRSYFKQVNERANKLGVRQEIEITTMGEFDVLDELAKRDKEFHLKGPMHFVLILGFSDGLKLNKKTYEAALDRIDKFKQNTGFHITVSCGAVIRPKEAAGKPEAELPAGQHDYREVMRWVAADDRIDAFRVGLEDTPKLYGNQQTNGGLVEEARKFFEDLDVRIEMNPKKVRKIFGMEKREVSRESQAR